MNVFWYFLVFLVSTLHFLSGSLISWFYISELRRYKIVNNLAFPSWLMIFYCFFHDPGYHNPSLLWVNINITQLQFNNARNYHANIVSNTSFTDAAARSVNWTRVWAYSMYLLHKLWHHIQLNSESISKGWERRETRLILKHQHAQKLRCHHLNKYNRYTVCINST